MNLTSMFKVIPEKEITTSTYDQYETIISGDVIALVALHYNPNLDSEDLVKNFQEYILVSEERMQSFLNIIHEQHPDLVSELYARGDTDNESFIVHSIFKENSPLTSMAQLVEKQEGAKEIVNVDSYREVESSNDNQSDSQDNLSDQPTIGTQMAPSDAAEIKELLDVVINLLKQQKTVIGAMSVNLAEKNRHVEPLSTKEHYEQFLQSVLDSNSDTDEKIQEFFLNFMNMFLDGIDHPEIHLADYIVNEMKRTYNIE